MASFPMRCCQLRLNIGNDLKQGRIPASSVFFPCQSRDDPAEKDDDLKQHKAKGKTRRLPVIQYLGGTVKKLMGNGLKENLNPKQKGGDWKDLLLMSISFAVYVYISQMIVCAYCVWMSSLKQHW